MTCKSLLCGAFWLYHVAFVDIHNDRDADNDADNDNHDVDNDGTGSVENDGYVDNNCDDIPMIVSTISLV